MLPAIMVNSFAAYLFSVLITAGTMLVVSLFCGWHQDGELLHEQKGGWLRTSQQSIQQLGVSETADRRSSLPLVLGVLVVLAGCWLSFVVFW